MHPLTPWFLVLHIWLIWFAEQRMKLDPDFLLCLEDLCLVTHSSPLCWGNVVVLWKVQFFITSVLILLNFMLKILSSPSLSFPHRIFLITLVSFHLRIIALFFYCDIMVVMCNGKAERPHPHDNIKLCRIAIHCIKTASCGRGLKDILSNLKDRYMYLSKEESNHISKEYMDIWQRKLKWNSWIYR